MKIGFSLPNIGPIGTAEAVTKVAQRAEELGYHSLWTIERLLSATTDQTWGDIAERVLNSETSQQQVRKVENQLKPKRSSKK